MGRHDSKGSTCLVSGITCLPIRITRQHHSHIFPLVPKMKRKRMKKRRLGQQYLYFMERFLASLSLGRYIKKCFSFCYSACLKEIIKWHPGNCLWVQSKILNAGTWHTLYYGNCASSDLLGRLVISVQRLSHPVFTSVMQLIFPWLRVRPHHSKYHNRFSNENINNKVSLLFTLARVMKAKKEMATPKGRRGEA